MNQRKKDFAAGAGWTLNIVMVAILGVFIWYCNQPTKEEGYYQEQRARLDELFADSNKDIMKHLSVANIGLDAEMVMERVNE